MRLSSTAACPSTQDNFEGASINQHKITFTERFKNHLPLHLHMTLILLATGFSGFLTTRLLLTSEVEIIVYFSMPLSFFMLFNNCTAQNVNILCIRM